MNGDQSFSILIKSSIICCFCCTCFLQGISSSLASPLQYSVEDTTIAVCQNSPILAELPSSQLKTLSYTQQRVARAFCSFDKIEAADAKYVATKILPQKISFETLLLVEYFTTLPQATITQTLKLIEGVRGADIEVLRAINAIKPASPPDSTNFLSYGVELSSLEGPLFWTVKELIDGGACSFEQLVAITEQLTPLDTDLLKTVEAFLARRDSSCVSLGPLIENLKVVPITDVWNLEALFSRSELTSGELQAWVSAFFLQPQEIKEKISAGFTTGQKKIELEIYDSGAENPIRVLNNLHDVTDEVGREIGEGQLLTMTDGEILSLFKKLHPAAQLTWRKELGNAMQGEKDKRISRILHKATEQARKEIAAELTSSNIYILLCRGGELYTSSFRNILTPALQARIATLYNGELLNFLAIHDPENLFTSQFITNISWRGVLSLFMPDDADGQKKLLDLVTTSALQAPFSLLHFSASFEALFKHLQPEARYYFIEQLQEQLFTGNKISVNLLQLLLQSFVDRFADLFDKQQLNDLKRLLKSRGYIDSNDFQTTPFLSWLEDKKLQSLSIFQLDDDGRRSFLSFCETLREYGYTPSISKEFSAKQLPLLENSNEATILHRFSTIATTTVGELFTLSTQYPLLINWRKVVNGVEIIHTTGVYYGREHQRNLLNLFLRMNIEMYAQRGHSYYRKLQLLRPLKELQQTTDGLALNSFQRFLSLGSCGGIHAYLELTRIFRNRVDILATVGTGTAQVNNQYNLHFFEIIVEDPNISWQNLARAMRPVFEKNGGKEYLQPGSLTAVLHKKLYQLQNNGTH